MEINENKNTLNVLQKEILPNHLFFTLNKSIYGYNLIYIYI